MQRAGSDHESSCTLRAMLHALDHESASFKLALYRVGSSTTDVELRTKRGCKAPAANTNQVSYILHRPYLLRAAGLRTPNQEPCTTNREVEKSKIPLSGDKKIRISEGVRRRIQLGRRRPQSLIVCPEPSPVNL